MPTSVVAQRRWTVFRSRSVVWRTICIFLTTLSRTLSIAEFVKEVKRVSTKWIQERGGPFAKFHWQAGYGCFSVSESNTEAVRRYIANQEAHHQKRSF